MNLPHDTSGTAKFSDSSTWQVHIERLGKFSRTVGPGIHLITPFVESIKKFSWTYEEEGPGGVTVQRRSTLTRISTKDQIYDVPPISVVLADKHVVTINAIFMYRIKDAYNAVYAVEDLPLTLKRIFETKLQAACAEMSLDQVVHDRRNLQSKLFKNFGAEETDAWGVTILSVGLQGVTLTKELQIAFEKKSKVRAVCVCAASE